MKHSGIFATILIILFSFHAVVFATELLVPSQYSTIQYAINVAVEGDIVIVEPNTYTGGATGQNVNLEFQGHTITVRSIDPNDPNIVASTIIDCVTTDNIGFNCHSNTTSTIAGFTIINGSRGIRCVGASPTITNCVISGHTTSGNGGGIRCWNNSNPTISNCTITGNNTVDSSPGYGDGGGISCEDNSNPLITNCIISENSTPYNKGGGIYCYQSNPTIKNCIITENSAAGGDGGGLYNDQSLPTVSNCIISKNLASKGGGIYGIYGGCITNCTVIGNTAGLGGGIFCHTLSNFTVDNCILRGNSPDQIGNEEPGWASGTPVSYTNIEGGWTGPGNIDIDPCFVDPDANDFHLKSEGWRWDVSRQVWTWDNVTSRCIDAGNPGSPLGEELLTIPSDPNNQWGENLRINMGAYGGTAEASMPPYDWALLADLNNDGTANWQDYCYMADEWLVIADEQPGDLNRDGIVDMNDVALFGSDWRKQTTWYGP